MRPEYRDYINLVVFLACVKQWITPGGVLGLCVASEPKIGLIDMNKNKTYKALLTHTGAMIDEMRLLINRFNPEVDTNTWVEEIIRENALGKAYIMVEIIPFFICQRDILHSMEKMVH